MPDVAVAPLPPRLPAWFIVALLLLASLFFGWRLHRADGCTLRGDEIVTLRGNWRVQPLDELIARGAGGQVSPAPLLYVADFVAERLRVPLRYLGLTPSGYVRLPSLMFSTVLGIAAALAVAFRILRQDAGGSPLQFLLILCGLASYWFHPKVFAFAGVERPYGLWNGLWFLLLAWLLGRPPLPKVPLVLLSLLAASASAACFQILALGIAMALVRRVERRPAKELFKDGVLLLALPALIGIYYAARSIEVGDEEGSSAEKVSHFLRFWLLSNLHVWLAGGAMSWLALRRVSLRDLAIPPVALTALMLLMPLIFAFSHLKGYSMVSRHYIWTSTAVPLALFFAASVCPPRPTPRLRTLVLVAAVAIAGGNVYATYSRPEMRNDSRELAILRPESPLRRLLQSERPAALWTEPGLGYIEFQNLALLAEWISVRYASLPRGQRKIVVVERKGQLVAEEERREAPPGGAWRLIELPP